MRVVAALASGMLSLLATARAQTIVDGSGGGLSPQEQTLITSRLALGFADPVSTRIRDIRAPSDARLCGEIDGKNASGAYRGFRPFLINKATGDVTILDPQDPPELQDFHKRTFSLSGCPVGPDGNLLTFN